MISRCRCYRVGSTAGSRCIEIIHPCVYSDTLLARVVSNSVMAVVLRVCGAPIRSRWNGGKRWKTANISWQSSHHKDCRGTCIFGVFHLFPVPEMGAPQNSTYLNNHDRTLLTTRACYLLGLRTAPAEVLFSVGSRLRNDSGNVPYIDSRPACGCAVSDTLTVRVAVGKGCNRKSRDP